mmetsp:Transcript_20107/g.59709  ORF Transcript_20107/g.59709 Transcript_20107/m.59709 type:complete len:200 (+) Transcript_20107:124-723(+)
MNPVGVCEVPQHALRTSTNRAAQVGCSNLGPFQKSTARGQALQTPQLIRLGAQTPPAAVGLHASNAPVPQDCAKARLEVWVWPIPPTPLEVAPMRQRQTARADRATSVVSPAATEHPASCVAWRCSAASTNKARLASHSTADVPPCQWPGCPAHGTPHSAGQSSLTDGWTEQPRRWMDRAASQMDHRRHARRRKKLPCT